MRDNEEALLGVVMRDGSLYEQLREIVKPEHFGNHAYGQAWLACEHLFENSLGIDTVTVGDELERMGADFSQGEHVGRALLTKLRADGEPRNALSYAENVQDAHAKRQLTDFFAKCAYWSANGRRAKDILKDVNKELSGITLYSANDEYTVPISEAASRAFDLTDAASKNLISGVQTGILDLDRLLGSLAPQNVYIMAGRPGQGKSAFLLNVARNAAKHGKKVLVFSLETAGAKVAQRLIAQEAEIDLHSIVTGHMSEEQWAKYLAVTEAVGSWPITVNDLSSISISQIRQIARKYPADLIVVDYIQLADSGEKRNERRELDVSAVSRGLKYLARELDVPVLAAAQMSRAVEARAGQRPILSDLRESGSLEQDAFCVMFLYHDDSGTEIIVAKHRDGAVASVPVIWRKAFTRFDNAAMFRPNV